MLLCVELGNTDRECLADIIGELTGIAESDLCLVDIYVDTAAVRTDDTILNYAGDLNIDRCLVLESFLQSCLVLLKINSALGQDDLLALIRVLDALYNNSDLLVILDSLIKVKVGIIGKFSSRNLSFGLVMNINIDKISVSRSDLSFYYSISFD